MHGLRDASLTPYTRQLHAYILYILLRNSSYYLLNNHDERASHKKRKYVIGV